MSITQDAIRHAVMLGYKADHYGNVIGSRGVPLKLQVKKSPSTNYRHFGVKYDGMVRKLKVATLVAFQKFGDAAFAPGIHIRHRNNDSFDDSWDNIILGTPSQNMMDRPAAERQAHSALAASKLRKFDEARLAAFRADRTSGMSLNRLAAKYGVSKSTCSLIASGKTYA